MLDTFVFNCSEAQNPGWPNLRPVVVQLGLTKVDRELHCSDTEKVAQCLVQFQLSTCLCLPRMATKRGREEEQANGLAEEYSDKKPKLGAEENILGLDMDDLPVTAVFSANTSKGQVKKGKDCPYLDTISRQVSTAAF